MQSPHTAEDNKLDALTYRTLTRKSPWPWLRDAAIDWSVIAATMYIAGIWNNPLGYLLAILVIGNRQHALAILGHDGTHLTVSGSKRINDALTNLIAFWCIGLTASGYRNLHFRHHKYTNTVDDPELQHRAAKAPQWDLPVTLKKVLRYAALDMVGYSLSDYLIIVAFAKPDKKSSYGWMAVYHAIAATALAALGGWWIAALWYVSLPTAFMMFFRLRTWLEHQGSDDTHKVHLNLVQRLLLSPHYAWYHYEHHHWPSVPYYNLPVLRQLLGGAPAIPLTELIARYEAMPHIPSGKALKASAKPAEASEAPVALAA